MHRRIAVSTLLAIAALGAAPRPAYAQALIPHQMHRSATFELHSLHDDVQLYEGEPQQLFRLDVRPERSLLPRIEFSNNNQVVVLRVRDLATLEPAALDSARLAENAALGIDENPEQRAAVKQDWKIELAPASPTDFLLHCEGGKSLFDFTDLPVQSVHLLADTAIVRVEFGRPNPATLDRFKLSAHLSRLEVRGFANARARSTTFQLEDTHCELDLTGKLADGDFEVFFEGLPTQLRLTLPERAGFHVEGPAATVGKFDRDGMAIVGAALRDGDYAERRTRIRLHFSQAVPQLDVRWRND